MANTPPPCDSCVNVYYDAMTKDRPDYDAECKIPDNEKNWGNKDCPYYLHWTYGKNR